MGEGEQSKPREHEPASIHMPLQPCRECRHAVSTEAVACPSCGAAHPAGVHAGAIAVREGGTAVSGGTGGVAGPSPEFWRATRLLFRRVRVAFYGVGSGLFAAILTGSLVLEPTRWMQAAGLLAGVGACLLAVILELLELNLGKGGMHED
jgi:hypothetical protein